MSTTLVCPQCGKRFRPQESTPDAWVTCPECGLEFESDARDIAPARKKLTSRSGASRQARTQAGSYLAEAEANRRNEAPDYGSPWYLWLLAVMPMGIPLLTCGGCLWFILGPVLTSLCLAIARHNSYPIAVRLVSLLVANFVIYSLVIVLILSLLGGLPEFRLPQLTGPAGPPPEPVVERPPPVVKRPEPPTDRPVKPPKDPVQPPARTPTSPRLIPDLLAGWSFDALGTTGRAPELTGRAGDATLHGAALTDGIRGKAVRFDGHAGWCDYGNSPRLNFSNKSAFTLAGWLKTDAASGIVLSQRNSRDAGTILTLALENGRLLVLVRPDGSSAEPPDRISSGQPINDNQWHHFALTRTAVGVLELNVDGSSQGGASSPRSAGPLTTDLRSLGSDRFRVKEAQPGGVSTYLRGSMDEFCIFGRALRDDEIRRLAGK